jgi:hypothetical protein
MRTAAITTLILVIGAALPEADSTVPLPPTRVSWDKSPAVLGEVSDALSKASGVEIGLLPVALKKAPCPVRFKDVPFWEALQQTADATRTRIVTTDGGRKVNLVPRGAAGESIAISGPFRIVAHRVDGRALLDLGTTVHEVYLLVHWEPRLRVFRIDTAPEITKVADVPGSKPSATGGRTQTLPVDATAELKVQLNGLTRASDRITALGGTFTVTAAERMLAFAFDPTANLPANGTLPAGPAEPGVTAVLKRVQKKGDIWEIAIDVSYPERQPVFESFQGEWWLRDNRMILRSADGKTNVIEDCEIPSPDSARPLRVIYRFKEDAAKGLGNPTAKGSTIIYETPAPLVEFKVPFELKEIPLP